MQAPNIRIPRYSDDLEAGGQVPKPVPVAAPPNSLPDWFECSQRVANSNFIAKRMANGGPGPDPDSKLASQLHRFIYEYDDADPYRSAWFLHRLELVLDEVRREAGLSELTW